MIRFDLSTMTIACVLILLAVLAANGRLQNVINAFNGSLMPQPATTTPPTFLSPGAPSGPIAGGGASDPFAP